jgi:hypothetical protein
MDFEHLVQINDPLLPLLDPLSRGQLWRGLVRRALDPVGFVLGMDGCTVMQQAENRYARELRFGRHVMLDHVTLVPDEEVRYESDVAGHHAGSRMAMRIEEPAPGALFVRFRYHTVPAPDETPDPRFDQARRAAYREADIDTVRKIRELVAHGELG